MSGEDRALPPAERARFHGHLAKNLMHFGRALRAAGLRIGSDQIALATHAVAAVGVEERDLVYWALAACFVRRREERVVFDEAFELFFRDPFAMSHALAALISRTSIPAPSHATRRRGARADAPAAARRRTTPGAAAGVRRDDARVGGGVAAHARLRGDDRRRGAARARGHSPDDAP